VAEYEQYHLRTDVVQCINDGVPSVTAIGVHFIEEGDLSIVISYIGQDQESLLASYQQVMRCALIVPGWKTLIIVDVAFQPVETLDDGKTHFVATIYDKMLVPRIWAEDVAEAEMSDGVELELKSGLENNQIEYINLSYFGFQLPRDLVNGDLGLAIRRLNAAVEAAKAAQDSG